MTIKQQISAILEHPYYKEALRSPADMEQLLFEVMCHTYMTVAGNCARAYRGAKRMNGPQIVEAIRDVEPPCNLDVRLPFVVPREVAVALVVPRPSCGTGAAYPLPQSSQPQPIADVGRIATATSGGGNSKAARTGYRAA